VPSLRDTIRDYRTSLATLREIRSLDPDLPPAEAFAYLQNKDGIAANQKPKEIVWLLELLRRDPPAVVLEIGTQLGGSLFLFTRVAAPSAVLISVDAQQMVGRLGRFSPYAMVRYGFARSGQRIELVDRANSHDVRTRERVERLLGNRPVDFLFIDGGHEYEDVRRDFELYAPLVPPGGLVGFHDVSPLADLHTEGVARFWSQLKAGHETEECVADDGVPGYGIGVYRVREQGEADRFIASIS
jgi:predicted O-methyltransferase YrrM